MQSVQHCDVFVVGAGLAGLQFLNLLIEETSGGVGGVGGKAESKKESQSRRKLKVILMDKKDRVGGRIVTYTKGEFEKHWFEGGPSRFSEHHSEFLSLLKLLKISTQAISGSSSYLALGGIKFDKELDKDRNGLTQDIVHALKLDASPEIVEILKKHKYDPNEVFMWVILNLMNPDFQNPRNAQWLYQYSGISYLRFVDLLIWYLAAYFEERSAANSQTSKEEATKIWKNISEEKKQFGVFHVRPVNLTSSFSLKSTDSAKRLSAWLVDSFAYCSEFEMNAIFGRGLVLEIVRKQKWFTLDKKTSGGLGGVCKVFEKYIMSQNQIKSSKQEKITTLASSSQKFTPLTTPTPPEVWVSVEKHLGVEVKSLEYLPEEKKWRIRCPAASDGMFEEFLATSVVFTGSNSNLQHVLEIPSREGSVAATAIPFGKSKDSAGSSSSSSSSSSLVPNSIPSSNLWKYLFHSISPKVLLRIFAHFPYNPINGKYWYEGIPRVVSSGRLKMILPVHASTSGILQISYTDSKYSLPWLDLLKEGKKDKSVVYPSPPDKDFGTATSQSLFGKEIIKELRILFPKEKIPDPLQYIWHPCICHYAEPEQPDEFSISVSSTSLLQTSPPITPAPPEVNKDLGGSGGEVGYQVEKKIDPAKDMKVKAKQAKTKVAKVWSYLDLGLASLNPAPGLFLCGEAYNNQFVTKVPTGWMESALRTVHVMLPLFWKWMKEN